MVDKELKDWCETCNIEPPAMKFNCPECEHNPDKEQIIIDGIECKNYNNGTCQEGYRSCSVANIISCDPQNIRCDFYIDRIEEQLARKTQIVKQQQKTLDEIIGCVSIWEGFTEEESKLAKDSSIADLIVLLRKKTQECGQIQEECKELKLENQELYTILSDLKEARKLKDEYVQKCEKLKSQVDEDYNYYTTELKTLRDIISNKEKRNAALFLTCGHYRTAMEEIEKVINNIFSSCLGHKTKGCTPVHNVCEELTKMLNIIRKAKEYKSD